MSSKLPKLDIKSCPICGNTSAINTNQAYLAYHSKYFVKLRKRAENLPPRKGPQVGRIGSVGEAMLDADFAKYLKRIRLIDPLRDWGDGFQWKFIPWMIGAVVIVLIVLGIDSTLVEITLSSVVVIMLWVDSKLDNGFLKKYVEHIQGLGIQWFCLKCKHHWVESKRIPKR